MRWCNVRNAIIVDKEKRKMFTYTEEKKFTKEQVQQLFLSVNWISGKYPERLYKAVRRPLTEMEEDHAQVLIQSMKEAGIL